VSIRVDESTSVDYTVKANDSSLRDGLVATAVLQDISKALNKVTSSPGDPPGTVTAPGATAQNQEDNFFKVFNDLGSMMTDAMSNMQTPQQNIAQTQATLSQVQTSHKTEESVMQTNISNAENVDMNDVATKISSLQVQLEAAYQVASSLKNLNLANYLPLNG
jgi:flagellar hook-associated protein 3 FlgL